MNAAPVEQYRRWFEYEKASHARVLASLESVPEEKRASADFRKAVGLAGHMVSARMLWLSRLSGTPAPRALFPAELGLADLAAGMEEMHKAWTAYLGGLSDGETARILEYTSLDGGRYRNSVGDLLTQLFGHSWYHRGQVALLVRSLGGVPAVTDFVFWAREPAG